MPSEEIILRIRNLKKFFPVRTGIVEDLFSKAISLLPGYTEEDVVEKIHELKLQARELLFKEDKEEHEEH